MKHKKKEKEMKTMDEEFTREEIEAMERSLRRDVEWYREVDEEERSRTLAELESEQLQGCGQERLDDFTLLERDFFARSVEADYRHLALWAGRGAALCDLDEAEALAHANVA